MTREEAIKFLELDKESRGKCFISDAIDMAIKALDQEPKTGHWIIVEELHGEWEGTKKYACDKCGEKVGVFKSNYCPNCGARMVESEEQTDMADKCYTCRFCKINNHGSIYCSLREKGGQCIGFDNWESQEDVLDKIRAEIEQTSETVDGFLMHDGTKRTVLQILDKYKAESEE